MIIFVFKNTGRGLLSETLQGRFEERSAIKNTKSTLISYMPLYITSHKLEVPGIQLLSAITHLADDGCTIPIRDEGTFLLLKLGM